jgi:hypothetical protein
MLVCQHIAKMPAAAAGRLPQDLRDDEKRKKFGAEAR